MAALLHILHSVTALLLSQVMQISRITAAVEHRNANGCYYSDATHERMLDCTAVHKHNEQHVLIFDMILA
jgi:hypothetical protein